MLSPLLGMSNSYDFDRLLIAATPVLKTAIKLTEVKLHGNNVCDVTIVHVIQRMHKQTNKQTDRCGKRKAILRPAGCVRSLQPAGPAG